MRLLSSCFFVSALCAGCDDTVVVQVRTGARALEIDGAQLAMPRELRDESPEGGPRIASYPCGPDALCPRAPELAIECVGAICDPEPYSLTAPLGEVVDVDVLSADARDLLRHVESIEVIAASYAVAMSTLTIDVPAIEIVWAPESAAGTEPEGELVVLGALPAMAAGAIGSGEVVLDPQGVARLSGHLVGRSRRVQLFARMRLDLAPGDAYPEGTMPMAVDLEIRITGSVVR